MSDQQKTPSADQLKVGIAGLGTVGTGVIKIISQQADILRQRTGRDIVIKGVSARDPKKLRDVDLSAFEWFGDPMRLAREADIDIYVELMGGADGIALASVEGALKRGVDVVTANKALMAAHGTRLAQVAEENNAVLAYEAAIAGGIPIVKALREGLAGNGIDRIYGILNGTCNYILTTMEKTGRPFKDVLADAQDQGYAEADPSFDIGGIDAAHKLSVLAALAFGRAVDFDAVYVEGIERIGAEDIAYASEFGYRIKLIGAAKRTAHGIEQRVHPCLVPLDTPIASVDDVYNAVVVEGDAVGQATFEGRGAGEGPTASAVTADIADIARGLRLPTFSIPAAELAPAQASPMEHHEGAYYLRLNVLDKPGVMAAITIILAEAQVSIASIIQRGRSTEEAVPIVILTHETREAVMMAALDKIRAHEAVMEEPHVIRIETF